MAPEASYEVDSIARKSLTAMLRAVESVGQNNVAKALDVDDATVSNDKSKYWPRFTKTLALLGFKLVPVSARCYKPETIEPLLVLAKQRMAQLDSVDQLQWDES